MSDNFLLYFIKHEHAIHPRPNKNEGGCMSDRNPKQGKPLSDETAELVRIFYMRDDISRP